MDHFFFLFCLFDEYNDLDNSTFFRAVLDVFPEYDWIPWKFRNISRGFFDDVIHQRQYFDWLSEQLQFQSMEEWYDVTSTLIGEYGGSTFMHLKYGKSVEKALKNSYPDTNWHAWRFARNQSFLWDDLNVCSDFLDWIFDSLSYQTDGKWNIILCHHVKKMGGATFLQKYLDCTLILSHQSPGIFIYCILISL
jgi:hypothetical protein